MKKSKTMKNLVKITVIRASQYDRYMKKFQPKATCQCRAVYVQSIKPARSDFRILETLKIIMSNFAGHIGKLGCYIKRSMYLTLGVIE